AASVVALEVAVLFGRGDGTFEPQRILHIPAVSDNFPFTAVRAADLNEDGKIDLVVSGSSEEKVFPFLGNEDRSFTRLPDVPSAKLGTGLALVDISGDANLDVIATRMDGVLLSITLGNGDGTFQEHRDFFAGQNPIAVAIADVGSQVILPDGS